LQALLQHAKICPLGASERERTLFATTLQKQTTIQTVNMWQAARKVLKPIELATKKGKKLKTQT